MDTRPYIPALTSMRGLAAVLVMLGHFGPFFPVINANGIPVDNYMWVDFFFILSGFVLARSYSAHFKNGCKTKTYAGFMGRRLLRIYPVHLVALGAMVLVEMHRYAVYASMRIELPNPAFGDTGDKSMPALFENLLLVQSWGPLKHFSWNQPSWSLSCEFLAYLLFPLLVYGLYRVGSALLTFGFLLIGYAVLIVIDHPLSQINITPYQGLLGFSLGVALYRIYISNLRFPRMHCAMLQNLPSNHPLAGVARWVIAYRRQIGAAAIDLMIGALLVMCIFYFHFFDAKIFMIIMYCVLIFALARHRRGIASRLIDNPLFRYLGLISYSIYLWHFVVLNFLDLVVLESIDAAVNTLPDHTSLRVLFFFVTITLGVSTISYLLLERMLPMLFRRKWGEPERALSPQEVRAQIASLQNEYRR
jgi:peptidoglycan/LPS O-acetylase OafA/YrhL